MHIGQRQVAEPDHEQEPLDPTQTLRDIWPPQLSTTEADMEWRKEIQHAINRQAFDWAVAPGVSFVAPRSKLHLKGGAEVVIGRDVSLGEALILERRSVLLRGTEEGKRAAAGASSDSRFVVAVGQQISSLVGLLLGGAAVDQAMLEGGEQSLLSLVHRGVVLDRTKPPLSQIPADVALREREADLERAKADVDAAVEGLTADDNAKTQKLYVEKKLQLDLAGVRVEAARKAVAAAQAAEVERQRAELQAKITEIESQIKTCEGKDLQFRVAEIKAARALAEALHASNAHAEEAYQLRIGRNAMSATLNGGEMLFEHPPLTRLHQQLTVIGNAVDLDLYRDLKK